MDRGVWQAPVHAGSKIGHDLVIRTKLFCLHVFFLCVCAQNVGLVQNLIQMSNSMIHCMKEQRRNIIRLSP